MTKTWSDFEQLVSPEVPGCSPLVIRERLRMAFDDFCSGTNFWKVFLGPMSVFAGQADVVLPLEPGQRVVGVEKVKFGDRTIEPMTPRALDAYHPGWESAPSSSQPECFMVKLDDAEQFVTLWPTPSVRVDDVLRVRCSLRLDSSTDEIPEFFWQDWRQTLADGALGRILLIPGQNWTNAALAAYHEAQFRAGKSRARARVLGGMNGGNLRVLARRLC